MSDILYVTLYSLLSIGALFVLTKLMGYRQMSEMSMFDYINGITIGSIAAELATSLEEDFLMPLIAMIIYALVTVLLSVLADKSLTARRIINGTPILLLHNGQIYKKNLKRAKIDLNELMEQARINGYFSLDELSVVLLETNGRLSFLPKSENRPATPKDLALSPTPPSLSAVLILDGKLLHKHLQHTGKDEKWLKNQLGAFGVKSYADVLLATCDGENKLTVFPARSDGRERMHIL